MKTYGIHIEKDYLHFCSAHFITYDGHQCEALHGHNFGVRFNLHGPLDKNNYVLDFIPAKKMLKKICDSLDHRVLLPAESKIVTVIREEKSVYVEYQGKEYRLPVEDVVLLPLPNITSEKLAYYICQQMKETLSQVGFTSFTLLEVEVSETPGQGAIYRETNNHESESE